MDKSVLIKKIEESSISDSAISEINNVVERDLLPSDVREAMAYIASVSSDIGFMGSPKYTESKIIIERYEKSKRKK